MVHVYFSYSEEKTLLCVPNVTIQHLKCSEFWFCLGLVFFLLFVNFLVLVVITELYIFIQMPYFLFTSYHIM